MTERKEKMLKDYQITLLVLWLIAISVILAHAFFENASFKEDEDPEACELHLKNADQDLAQMKERVEKLVNERAELRMQIAQCQMSGGIRGTT